MKTLTTDQVEALLGDPRAVVINVLDRKYFEHAHIPGTISVPLDAPDFVQKVESSADKTSTIVVYCAGPDCPTSARAAHALRAAGFTNVYEYAGGMKAWIAARNPVTRAEPAA